MSVLLLYRPVTLLGLLTFQDERLIFDPEDADIDKGRVSTHSDSEGEGQEQGEEEVQKQEQRVE